MKNNHFSLNCVSDRLDPMEHKNKEKTYYYLNKKQFVLDSSDIIFALVTHQLANFQPNIFECYDVLPQILEVGSQSGGARTTGKGAELTPCHGVILFSQSITNKVGTESLSSQAGLQRICEAIFTKMMLLNNS